MKKHLIILLVFLPFLSFAQLTSEEKSLIGNHANNICSCINKAINTLDPKVVEFVNLMADEGEEKAMIQIEKYISTHSEEESKVLLAGFDEMSLPEFGKKIEKCDIKENLTSEMSSSIDNVEGKYADYFYNLLKTNFACKLTNYLMELGNKEE